MFNKKKPINAQIDLDILPEVMALAIGRIITGTLDVEELYKHVSRAFPNIGELLIYHQIEMAFRCLQGCKSINSPDYIEEYLEIESNRIDPKAENDLRIYDLSVQREKASIDVLRFLYLLELNGFRSGKCHDDVKSRMLPVEASHIVARYGSSLASKSPEKCLMFRRKSLLSDEIDHIMLALKVSYIDNHGDSEWLDRLGVAVQALSCFVEDDVVDHMVALNGDLDNEFISSQVELEIDRYETIMADWDDFTTRVDAKIEEHTQSTS